MAKASMNLGEPPSGLTKKRDTPLRKTLGGTPFAKAMPKTKRRSSRSPVGRRR